MRKTKFIALLTIGSLLTFGLTGCKDYDSDIADLQSQINVISDDIKALKTFAAGKFITSVTKTDNADGGFTVKFSDGTEFTHSNPAVPTYTFTVVDGQLLLDGNPIGTGVGFTYDDDGYLVINGKKTETKKEGPEAADPVFTVVDGELYYNGNPTGAKVGPGVPTDPSDPTDLSGYLQGKEGYVTGVELPGNGGWQFKYFKVDGTEDTSKSFTIPKSQGGGGIKSLVFAPQFTLDGKPAIYGQALALDTSNTKAGFGGDYSDNPDSSIVIYGDIAIHFKLNPVTTKKEAIDSVEVFVVQLSELRTARNPLNGEQSIKVDLKQIDVNAAGVLTVKLSHTEVDSLNSIGSIAPGRGKDDQKYMAVVLNGDIASAYIPYVSEVIPSKEVFIGENHNGKYVPYGVEPKNYNEDDSIHVIEYDYKNKTGVADKFDPVLVYQKTATKALPLSGFDPTWKYEELPIAATKELYKRDHDVVSVTTGKNHEVIQEHNDSIRVRIGFTLDKFLVVPNPTTDHKPVATIFGADQVNVLKALKDSTDSPRAVAARAAAHNGNALVKIRAKIKIKEAKDPDQTWYNGADSIRGDKSKIFLTSAEASQVNPTLTLGTGTTPPKEVTVTDSEGKPAAGIDWTTNNTIRDSLVASPGVKADDYLATWTIDGVPGITYIADYKVRVKNPTLVVTKIASYWDSYSELKNTQQAPGDTVRLNVTGTANPTKWVMVSVPSRGFSKDNSPIIYKDDDGNDVDATCGTKLEFGMGHLTYRLPEPEMTNDVLKDSAVVVRPINFPGIGEEYVVGITNKFKQSPVPAGELGVGTTEVADKYVKNGTDNPILVQLLVDFAPQTYTPGAGLPPVTVISGVGGNRIELPVTIADLDGTPIAMDDKSTFYLRFRNPLTIKLEEVKNMDVTADLTTYSLTKFWGTHVNVVNSMDPNRAFTMDSLASSSTYTYNPSWGDLTARIHRYFDNVTAAAKPGYELPVVDVYPMRVDKQGDGTGTYLKYTPPAGQTETPDWEGAVSLTFTTTWGEIMTEHVNGDLKGQPLDLKVSLQKPATAP